MKRTFWLLPLALAFAACSARGGGGGGTIDPPIDGDTTDTPVVEDTPVVDVPVVDVPVVDAPVVDVPVVDKPAPDVPVAPDMPTGRCARDSECTGSTWCDTSTGTCMPIVCTPGRVSCVSAMRARTCDARGASFSEMDCPGGCADGVCTGSMPTCTAPMAMCGTTCVNTQSDVANCGGCGRACAAGQACTTGVCTGGSTCTAPMTTCSGVCVNPLTDTRNCGTCGRACTTGQTCSSGVCTGGTTCSAPMTTCSGVCVNTATDAANCGGCGRACAAGQTCASGLCGGGACTPPLARCGSACVDPASDPMNCGACGRACPSGMACTASSCVALGTGTAFQITSLGSTGCAVIDHDAVTSDDRGGIAVGSSSVFYTGDTSTGRFDPEALTPTAVGRVYDGLFSNLRSGVVYSLATASGPHVNTPSGATFTSIVELDGITGLPTTRTVTLSMPLTLASDTGVFSGWDRVVFASAGHVYNVDLPGGRVTDLGTMVFPSHQTCENWAFWGVAEFIGGAVHLAYVESPTRIARVRVPDAMVSTVGAFTNLSDMCSFSVSPTRSRWYFHHEYAGQFGGSSETFGRCPAVIAAGGTSTCPAPTTMCPAGCVDLQTDVANCGVCARGCSPSQTCRAGVCTSATTFASYVRTTPPAGVAYEDVCAAPGATVMLRGADDQAVLGSLPFAFPFWGTTLASGRMVNISSNGFISLDGVASSGWNTIPSAAAPNGEIAAWGADIVANTTSGVCWGAVGTAGSRRFIVAWPNARPYGSTTSGLISTEIVLNEADGSIDLLTSNYTFASTATAVMGIESLDGTRGLSGCAATTATCTNAANNRVRFVPAP
ncbi:MAG: hypothetical protein U0326_23755 [Polyangiales bacterium]